MGTIIISNGNKPAYGVKELVIDFDEELEKLNVNHLTSGTRVFSIESSKHFILNSKKEWKEIDPLGSGIFTSTTINLDSGSIDK